MKTDDTNTIPETLSAPWLKRFFKKKLGIPVRVRTLKGKAGFIDVWIPSDRTNLHVLNYSHDFPPELGNRCVCAAYPGSEQLQQKNWAGNVGSHSIALIDRQWRQVLQSMIDQPIGR